MNGTPRNGANLPGVNGFAAKIIATVAAAGILGAAGALVRGEVHGDRLNQHLEKTKEVPETITRIDERTKYMERNMEEIKGLLRSIERQKRVARDDGEDDGE